MKMCSKYQSLKCDRRRHKTSLKSSTQRHQHQIAKTSIKCNSIKCLINKLHPQKRSA